MQAVIHLSLILSPFLTLSAQTSSPAFHFELSLTAPATQTFTVTLSCKGVRKPWLDFKMPAWMPGYYQIMNYAAQVDSFSATDGRQSPLRSEKADHNTWRVYTANAAEVVLKYKVRSTRLFVANNFVDSTHAFIAPPGTFMYLEDYKAVPATIHITPYQEWKTIATGLEPVAGRADTYAAPDFDVLFDSPVLIGNLDNLPPFELKGVPHYFTGYQLGTFDQAGLMEDLKSILAQAVEMMGEIPFRHYTFLAIGPGAGGIEHLNSAAVSFSGNRLDSRERRKGVLSFLTHEYFHHYNVKRIRPVELGPFDYSRENRTKSLWVAEGVTSYYEKIFMRRAGITSPEEMLGSFQRSIRSLESKPGHLFQSVAEASFDTWADGPFGRTGDDLNKTISYYEKGPILAMLLDFRIRYQTGNRQSLDDVMRFLYQHYYKELKRGYTEAELQEACEKAAGSGLDDFFSYIYTTNDIDYSRYLKYAGLNVDTSLQVQPGAWSGIEAREQDGKLIITTVDWGSPAWDAHIRPRQVISGIQGQKATLSAFRDAVKAMQPGDILQLEITEQEKRETRPLILGTKYFRSFEISRMNNPSDLQRKVLKSWLSE